MAIPAFSLGIDVTTANLTGGSLSSTNTIIPIIKNDVYAVELLFYSSEKVFKGQISGFQTPYSPYPTNNATVKFAIGQIDDPPSSGSFQLSCNGTTSTNIPYNATPAQVYSAVSNNVSTVNSYGSRGYLLVASQPNTAMSFGSDTNLLFPSSSAIISTRLNPSSGVTAQQTLVLVKNPAVFVDNFEIAQVTPGFTINGNNGRYIITDDSRLAENSSFTLSYGNFQTDTIFARENLVAVNQKLKDAFGTTVVTRTTQTYTYTPIGTSGKLLRTQAGVSVTTFAVSNFLTSTRVGYASGTQFLIYPSSEYLSSVNNNVSTAINLNIKSIESDGSRRSAVVTFSTSGIQDLFAENGTADEVTTTLEVELVENGNPRTVLQVPVTLKKDLIVAGSSLPGAIQQYYTKAETDAIFVEDLTTNVDASNRRLKNASGSTIVDYGQSLFGASGMVNLAGSGITIGAFPVSISSTVTATGAVSFGGGMAVSGNLGFYGTSPIAKPSGANAISNVISLGLISSSSTYGVLPGSIKTITTSVTLTFGTVAANDTTSVSTTITGSNINDIVLLGLPNALCAGLSFYGHVTTADVVEIDAVNGINSSRDQSAQTYRVTIIGY